MYGKPYTTMHLYLIYVQSIPKSSDYITCSISMCNQTVFLIEHSVCVCVCAVYAYQDHFKTIAASLFAHGHIAGNCGGDYVLCFSLRFVLVDELIPLFFVRIINFGRLRVQTLLMFYIICFSVCMPVYFVGMVNEKWKRRKTNYVRADEFIMLWNQTYFLMNSGPVIKYTWSFRITWRKYHDNQNTGKHVKPDLINQIVHFN